MMMQIPVSMALPMENLSLGCPSAHWGSEWSPHRQLRQSQKMEDPCASFQWLPRCSSWRKLQEQQVWCAPPLCSRRTPSRLWPARLQPWPSWPSCSLTLLSGHLCKRESYPERCTMLSEHLSWLEPWHLTKYVLDIATCYLVTILPANQPGYSVDRWHVALFLWCPVPAIRTLRRRQSSGHIHVPWCSSRCLPGKHPWLHRWTSQWNWTGMAQTDPMWVSSWAPCWRYRPSTGKPCHLPALPLCNAISFSGVAAHSLSWTGAKPCCWQPGSTQEVLATCFQPG